MTKAKQTPSTQFGRFLFLPASVVDLLKAKKINHADLFLLALVAGLSDKHGFCYATNKFLAQNSGLQPGTVSNKLNRLAKLGLLRIIVDKDPETNAIKQRRIYALFDYPIHSAMDTPIHSTMDTPPRKSGDINIDDNHSIDNNTNSISSKKTAYGKKEINFILDEIKKTVGKQLPAKRQTPRRWAHLMFLQLNKYTPSGKLKEDVQWLDDDWQKNLHEFLATVKALLKHNPRLELNYMDTLYNWLKVWLTNKGKKLFGVEAPWYIAWRHEQEVKRTQQKLAGKGKPKLPPELMQKWEAINKKFAAGI